MYIDASYRTVERSMSDAGWIVAKRTPQGADDVKRWLGDRLDGFLRFVLSEGLRADAFIVARGAETLGVLVRRGDLYVFTAAEGTSSPLDGRAFTSTDEAAALLEGTPADPMSLQPVWYS
jgi:hypothetical protein